MTPREHTVLCKKIFDDFIDEVPTAADANDHIYYDRMGKRISYKDWYILAQDVRYYLVDETACPTEFVRFIWCGVHPKNTFPGRPVLGFQVKVAHITHGGFEKYFSNELEARTFYEMLSFFFDQKRLKEYIEKIIMSL